MSAMESLMYAPELVQLADTFDENKVTPGVLGFLVFAAMGLAVWFLMKSMNRQMQKVEFDEAPEDAEKPGASAPASGPAGRGRS
ncbi:hypothetical protein QNO07_04255 [Streptomyces sp. 549]|uniref:hypothetical protein n=1 Tax=Streptomyces sp. 549 TaxID=3049076 RepID=UPI0024C3503C|nr:hypothetical protein [Streptomyces sp. 549]MDK1472644.1 hypothetical protein [Streptomyces sp. 549]